MLAGSGLYVLPTQRAFPDEEVIQLSGTVDARHSPAQESRHVLTGISALQTEAVIPIYVDGTQTANDVARRIAQAIDQAVLRGELLGVVPHRLGNLGYATTDPNDIPKIHRVNVEGAVEITASSGAGLPFVIQGVVGLNDPLNNLGNVLAPIDTDMTRDEVASVVDGLLEDLVHNPTIITQTGLYFDDGDSFVLDDGFNSPVVYEFDSGYVLYVPVGGGSVARSGIADGEYFTISDEGDTVRATFEFDKDGAGMFQTDPDVVRIPIQETDSAVGISRLIEAAVAAHPNSGLLGLLTPASSPTPLYPRATTGNRVQLGGNTYTKLTFSPGSHLQQYAPLVATVPAGGGAAIADGHRITFTAGLNSVVFEFNKFGGTAVNSVPINITNADTAAVVAEKIVTAVEGYRSRDLFNLTAIPIGSRVAFSLDEAVVWTSRAPFGADPFAWTTVPAANPGVSPLLSLQLPQTLGMQLPEPLTLHVPPAGIADGETFTIDDGVGVPVTFEFDSNGAVQTQTINNIPIPNTPVTFRSTSTAEDLGRAIVAAINAAGFAFEATMIGGTGNVDLGGGGLHSVTLPAGSTLFPTGPLSLQVPFLGGAGIIEGEVFHIDYAGQRFTFEFDSNGIRQDPTATLITYLATDSADRIADQIVSTLAIIPGLDLMPVRTSGPVRIVLGAASNVTVDTAQTHLNQTGVSDGLADGDRFVIANGAQTVTFEFDTNGVYNPLNAIVDIAPGSTQQQIAGEIIHEIDLKFPDAADPYLEPRHQGDGRIHLGGTAQHNLDTAASPGIVQFGVGGPIRDGQTFILSEHGNGVQFEFDKDGNWNPANRRIVISDTMPTWDPDPTVVNTLSRITAQAIAAAGLNLYPKELGGGELDLNANEYHNVTLTSSLIPVGPMVVQVPAAGGGVPGVVDGDTFTFTDAGSVSPRRTYVFEFDNNGTQSTRAVNTATEVVTVYRISFQGASTQNEIAQEIVNVVGGVAALGFTPRYLGGGVVDFAGDPLVYPLSFNTTTLSFAGTPGRRNAPRASPLRAGR